ncbi:MAG TPA: hypothetical protein VGN11_04825 [Candidatus Baltobacteraceae bacterium]|jgi:carbonic anhydrase/acetyltransferase-like protein (isoleucine patch superfamily)|nr:hypothetical protein [Candidatus Baltobacteraceae bacterium]
MIYSSGTKKPKIHPGAYVAPSATVSGDVTIGAGSAVLHGAIVVAEGAPVTIGSDCVIMENAVVKSSGGSALQFPASIGDRCIVGPHAFVTGATLGRGTFVGSGAKLYNGVTLPDKSRIDPNAVRMPQGDFFETVFNLQGGADVHERAAQTYAQFLRKAHAQDAALAEHAHPQASRRRSGEEPPPQQMAEVEGVVDAMMLELQEMQARRQDSVKKKSK